MSRSVRRLLRPEPEVISDELLGEECPWKEVQFQLYINISLVRHTGIRVTFCNENDKHIWLMDWGSDGLFILRLTNRSDIEKHAKDNSDAGDRITISLQNRKNKFKLGLILEEIHSFGDDHHYNVSTSDPSAQGLNCRGFCTWVFNKLKEAQFSAEIDQRIDAAQGRVNKKNSVDAPFLVSGKLFSSVSGSVSRSSKSMSESSRNGSGSSKSSNGSCGSSKSWGGCSGSSSGSSKNSSRN